MVRKTKTIVKYQVTLELPSGMNLNQMRDYIREAIDSYRRAMLPDEPILEADLNMSVGLLKKEVYYG